MLSKNKKLMICLNGCGGVGKDELVEFCRNEAYSKDTYIANLSTIDMIRQAGRLIGCVDKKENDRKFLSDLKCLSKKYNNHPRNYIKDQIKSFCNVTGNTIVFVHSREIEEIKEFKEYFIEHGIVDYFISVLVKNKNVEKIVSNESDAGVEDYEYDYYIHNDGSLDELRDAAKMFIGNVVNVYFTE